MTRSLSAVLILIVCGLWGVFGQRASPSMSCVFASMSNYQMCGYVVRANEAYRIEKVVDTHDSANSFIKLVSDDPKSGDATTWLRSKKLIAQSNTVGGQCFTLEMAWIAPPVTDSALEIGLYTIEESQTIGENPSMTSLKEYTKVHTWYVNGRASTIQSLEYALNQKGNFWVALVFSWGQETKMVSAKLFKTEFSLEPCQNVIFGDIITDEQTEMDRSIGDTSPNKQKLRERIWPEGKVPYKLDTDFTANEKSVITSAMHEIQRTTCIKFEEYISGQEYLHIERHPNSRCMGSAGYERNKVQKLKLSSECSGAIGQILHFLLHVLGLWHEETLAQRDEYLVINYDNLEDPSDRSLYEKVDFQASSNEWYSPESILHSSRTLGAKPGTTVIDPKLFEGDPILNKAQLAIMGQRYGLAYEDITKMNDLYTCEAPFFDAECEDAKCEANGGEFSVCAGPNFCMCENLNTGAYCEGEVSCPRGCQNGGTCNQATKQCDCQSGFSGDVCQNEECTAVCQHGGTCVSGNTCDCSGTGYSGDTCNTPVCSGGCGHGSCTAPEHCTCDAGYKGAHCNVVICEENQCSHEGEECVPEAERISDSDLCRCKDGYRSTTSTVHPCEKVKVGNCPNSCSGHGVCQDDDTCKCNHGWDGSSDCATPVCDACREGSTCTGPNQCTCPDGWSGEQCNTPQCHKPCQNGGTCIGPDQCECPEKTDGAQCENIICHPACEHGGQCMTVYNPRVEQTYTTCKCQEGWAGDDCNTPYCRSCGHGKCVAPDTCECDPNWEGKHCDFKTVVYLDDVCRKSQQCQRSNVNTHCQKVSPDCNYGHCKCLPEYVQENGLCLEPRFLGEECNADEDICVKGAYCDWIEKTCICQDGMVPAPDDKHECIPATQTKRHGENCELSSECYNNLVCIDGHAKCEYQMVAESDYRCRAKALGDFCVADRDCHAISQPSRIRCFANRCSCKDGWRWIEYTDRNRSTSSTCVSVNYSDKKNRYPYWSGCDQTYGRVCKMEHICSECFTAEGAPDGDFRCRRLYASQSKGEVASGSSSSTTITASVIVIGFTYMASKMF